MFYAILGSILSALGTVWYKKIVSSNFGGSVLLMVFQYQIFFVLGFVLMFLGTVRHPVAMSQEALVALGLFGLFQFIKLIVKIFEPLAYKKEKVSALQPYSSISKIVAVLGAFFLLGETNMTTFSIAIFAFILSIVYFCKSSRGLGFSNGTLIYIGTQALRGLMVLCVGGILKNGFSVLEYMSYDAIFLTTFAVVVCLCTGKLSHIRTNPPEFIPRAYIGTLIDSAGYVLGIFLISTLGVIVSSLLSMFTLAVTFALGYIILGDIPKKSDMIFAFVVLSLVVVGYAFR